MIRNSAAKWRRADAADAEKRRIARGESRRRRAARKPRPPQAAEKAAKEQAAAVAAGLAPVAADTADEATAFQQCGNRVDQHPRSVRRRISNIFGS